MKFMFERFHGVPSKKCRRVPGIAGPENWKEILTNHDRRLGNY